jgi:acyl-CoA reductase-like NAD-dependent aldehyde dehydrogenase
MDQQTPIALITGSLGSGKTTLLKSIIRMADQRLAVVMNEFGEIAIDSRIIQLENLQMVELAGGCVCCELTGELEEAVKELIDKASPDFIIVEATGVAEVELGGSDPYVILEDADLDATVRTCVESRLLNSGQSCIAAKRFVVVDALREKFVKRFVEQMQAVKIGNPLDMDTDVGPLARVDLRDALHRQVQLSVEKGARCLLGGEIPEGKGACYPPTVLIDVKKTMPAYEEELFGSVDAIISAKDETEAITIANDTRFGLGAAVFTRYVVKGERIAATELEAGSCFVNAFVKSDSRLPFGGIKESGYGRELSHHGIKEFVNIKTVYVKQPLGF